MQAGAKQVILAGRMPPLSFFPPRFFAQASVEYIVLLAIALSIGMIVLAISGYFPSFSYSAQTGDSSRYWEGGASPIAIIDFMQADDRLSLVIENKASANLQISNFSLVLQRSAYLNTSGFSLPSGGKATISFATKNCSPRKTFSYDISINYSTDDVTGLSQTGLKPLYVTCKN